MTGKAFLERLYLVSGLSPFEPRVNCPCAPTPPPLTLRLFLDFCANFFWGGPSIFMVSTIRQVTPVARSNLLAEKISRFSELSSKFEF